MYSKSEYYQNLYNNSIQHIAVPAVALAVCSILQKQLSFFHALHFSFLDLNGANEVRVLHLRSNISFVCKGCGDS